MDVKVNREKEALLSVEYLNKVIDFNPDTGEAFWKKRTPDMFKGRSQALKERSCNFWNRLHAGKPCGAPAREYSNIRIGRYQYLAHRLFWFMHFGIWPEKEIDHKDGNGRNNCISNLQEVSRKDNLRNVAIGRNNTSGYAGVVFRKDSSKWRVTVVHNGVPIQGGCFSIKEEAISKAEEIYQSIGVSQRHRKEKKIG